MLESFLQMFTNPGPASFINFTFLPKYTFYFVQGVKYTLMLSVVAVLLAAMFFQAFEGPEIPGWISWLLLGIVIGNLFLSLAMHCWLQRKM